MIYEHYIDYTSEASNDMTFLESIDHMRKKYANSIERLTDENLYCSEDVNCNFSPNVTTIEANNSNDCDLELLVNPQTGLPVYDLSDEYSENASHPFVNSPSASVPDMISPSSTFTALSSVDAKNEPNEPLKPSFAYVIEPLNEKKSELLKIRLNNVSTKTINSKQSLVTIPIVSSSTPSNIQLSSTNPTSLASVFSSSSSTVSQTTGSNSNKVVLIQLSTPLQNANKPIIKKHDLKTSLSQLDPKHDKPPFSYSCLITMALKNSETGFLPVSEIYNYIVEKFPYFKTAPDGWKNSIRHNLSLNKCFQKIETPAMNGSTRKACLWGLNRAKITRLNEEIAKWVKKSSSGSAADIINEAFSSENNLTFEDIGDENDLLAFADESLNENIYNFTSYNVSLPFSNVTLPLSDGNYYQNIVPKSDDKKVWRVIKVDFPSSIKENNAGFKIIQNALPFKDQIHVQNNYTDQQLSPENPLLTTYINTNDMWEDLNESIELDQVNEALLNQNNCQTYRILSNAKSGLNFKVLHASDLIIR